MPCLLLLVAVPLAAARSRSGKTRCRPEFSGQDAAGQKRLVEGAVGRQAGDGAASGIQGRVSAAELARAVAGIGSASALRPEVASYYAPQRYAELEAWLKNWELIEQIIDLQPQTVQVRSPQGDLSCSEHAGARCWSAPMISWRCRCCPRPPANRSWPGRRSIAGRSRSSRMVRGKSSAASWFLKSSGGRNISGHQVSGLQPGRCAGGRCRRHHPRQRLARTKCSSDCGKAPAKRGFEAVLVLGSIEPKTIPQTAPAALPLPYSVQVLTVEHRST